MWYGKVLVSASKTNAKNCCTTKYVPVLVVVVRLEQGVLYRLKWENGAVREVRSESDVKRVKRTLTSTSL